MGRYKPLNSLNSFLSYAPQLSGAKSWFFLFTLRIGRCVLLALADSSVITMGVEAPVGPQFWEPSFTFRGQKSLMVVTFVVY